MDDEVKKEEVQEEKKEEEKGPEKPLDRMTATELRDVALGIPGLEGVHAMKKEELLKAIKEARGIKDEAPAKKAGKKEVSVSAMKERIVQLKQEKAAARETKDKKKVNVYRRRINRLKKRARKVA